MAKGAELLVDTCLPEEKRSTGGETEGRVTALLRNVLRDGHMWHDLVAYHSTLEISLVNDPPANSIPTR
jgi:hypothetical protein